MPKGTIRRLTDRGFGFIKTEEETDLFFHRNELEGVEFNSLSEGQEVEFEKGQGRDGRPQAVKVRLAEAKVKEEPLSAEETTEAPEAIEEGSVEGEVKEEPLSAEETTKAPEAAEEGSTETT